MSDDPKKPKRLTRLQKARRMLALKEQAGQLFKEARKLADQLEKDQEPGASIDLGGGMQLVLVDQFVDDAGKPKLYWARSAVRRCEWEVKAATGEPVAEPTW